MRGGCCTVLVLSYSRVLLRFHSSWIRSFLPHGLLNRGLKPPSARKIPSFMTVHGVDIQDDFAWIQNNNSETKKFIAAENRYAKNILGDTTRFQRKVMKELCSLENKYLCNGEGISSVDTESELCDNYKYYVNTEYDGYLVYCRTRMNKDGSCGPEEIILNVKELLKKHCCMSHHPLKPSKTHKFISYVLDVDGTDTYCGHILSMKSGQGELVDVLPNLVNLEWSSDDKTIFYTVPNEQKCPHELWRHTVGSDSTNDVLIYRETDPRFFLDVSLTKDGSYVTVNSNSKAASEVRIIDADKPSSKPVLVNPRQQGLEYFVEHRDGFLYIFTNFGGMEYKVVYTPVSHPCKEHWKPLFNYRNEVIVNDMEIFEKYCVLYETFRLTPQLTVVPLHSPQNMRTVTFSESVCTLEPGSNKLFSSEEIQFNISSPIQPIIKMKLNMKTNTLETLSRSTSNSFSEQFVCKRLTTISKDGTVVPMTVFHHSSIKNANHNPLLVLVYGAYGVSQDMSFQPGWLWFVSQGWCLAFCHVRGGGEMGRHWYHQARHVNKHKSFEDLEFCIKRLHERGYSMPKLTAVKGISAGGLTVASLMNTSSHLFNAAILKVPFVDVLTTMLDDSLPLTSQEYEEIGNPRQDPEILKYILSYCPYINLQEMRHVSVLVTSGILDERVPFWAPVKWIAKLRSLRVATAVPREKTADLRDGLVLLKVDLSSGHFGSTEETYNEIFAEEVAFLYKVLTLSSQRTLVK